MNHDHPVFAAVPYSLQWAEVAATGLSEPPAPRGS